MKSKVSYLIIGVYSLFAASAYAQPMAGTDELGRTLLQNEAVGNPKTDRFVALFYFLRQGDEHSKTSPKYNRRQSRTFLLLRPGKPRI